MTRPDIAYVVNLACQYMDNPSEFHFTLIKKILHCIKGTLTRGIQLFPDSGLTLRGFCVSDWAGCPLTRRNTTGFCVFLGPTGISSSSKNQRTVAWSSTEAEYRALAHISAELTWISSLLKDVNISQSMPSVVYSYSVSALQLTFNPVFHAQTKHVDIDYHFFL